MIFSFYCKKKTVQIYTFFLCRMLNQDRGDSLFAPIRRSCERTFHPQSWFCLQDLHFGLSNLFVYENKVIQLSKFKITQNIIYTLKKKKENTHRPLLFKVQFVFCLKLFKLLTNLSNFASFILFSSLILFCFRFFHYESSKQLSNFLYSQVNTGLLFPNE